MDKDKEKMNLYIADLVKMSIAIFDEIEETNELVPIEELDRRSEEIYLKHFGKKKK